MACVASMVRSPCVRSLAPRPRLRRGVDCARGQGSGEALIALEARARASRWLRSRPGLGRVASCTRGQGSGESLVVLEAGARTSRWLCSRPGLRSYCSSEGRCTSPVDLSSSFVAFYLLVGVSWFMVPDSNTVMF
jgi:hypothetical protein